MLDPTKGPCFEDTHPYYFWHASNIHYEDGNYYTDAFFTRE